MKHFDFNQNMRIKWLKIAHYSYTIMVQWLLKVLFSLSILHLWLHYSKLLVYLYVPYHVDSYLWFSSLHLVVRKQGIRILKNHSQFLLLVHHAVKKWIFQKFSFFNITFFKVPSKKATKKAKFKRRIQEWRSFLIE